MSRFVNPEAYDELELGNGDKVMVRQSLSGAEEAIYQANTLRFRITEEGKITTDGSNPFRWHVELLKAFIVNWNFKDDAGKAVVYQPEMVELLEADTVDEIATGIDKLQAKRKEEAQKKVRSALTK